MFASIFNWLSFEHDAKCCSLYLEVDDEKSWY